MGEWQQNLGNSEIWAHAGLSAISVPTSGVWTQLAPSTARAADGLFITAIAANTGTMLQLSFGASGSEMGVTDPIMVPCNTPWEMDIPLIIPAGTRIAAKNLTGGTAIQIKGVALRGAGNGFRASRYTALRAINNVPALLQNSGSGMGVPGAWVQLSAKCPPCSALLISAVTPGASGSAFEIGIGTSGSQTAIIGPVWMYNEGLFEEFSVPIPAGTAVWARASATSGTVSNQIALQALALS